MNLDQLKLLITEGEGLKVEFKEKYTPKIDRDITAMANARGGFILLGVNDEGKIIGEKLSNQLKAEILSIARNCDPNIDITRISQVDNAVVIEIAEGNRKPYSCASGYFRRLDAVTQKMTQQEVRHIFRQSAEYALKHISEKVGEKVGEKVSVNQEKKSNISAKNHAYQLLNYQGCSGFHYARLN